MHLDHGLSSPVFVPRQADWNADAGDLTTDQLLGLDNGRLAEVDPLTVNLIVAREIPGLEPLEIDRYQRVVNTWSEDLRSRCLPYWETFFHESPGDFRNDVRFFRLGMVAQYLDREVGISYNAGQNNDRRSRGDWRRIAGP